MAVSPTNDIVVALSVPPRFSGVWLLNPDRRSWTPIQLPEAGRPGDLSLLGFGAPHLSRFAVTR